MPVRPKRSPIIPIKIFRKPAQKTMTGMILPAIPTWHKSSVGCSPDERLLLFYLLTLLCLLPYAVARETRRRRLRTTNYELRTKNLFRFYLIRIINNDLRPAFEILQFAGDTNIFIGIQQFRKAGKLLAVFPKNDNR